MNVFLIWFFQTKKFHYTFAPTIYVNYLFHMYTTSCLLNDSYDSNLNFKSCRTLFFTNGFFIENLKFFPLHQCSFCKWEKNDISNIFPIFYNHIKLNTLIDQLTTLSNSSTL